MGTVSLSLPSDGQTIDAADVNTPFNTIATAINGNLDDTNIASGANINGTKLLAASIPGTAADANFAGGWITGVTVPNTIAANGNRSYTLTVNSTDLTSKLSAGMRLKMTRTVTAPTQCTSLNGSTQYYSKSSPSAMTFTNNFVVSAWVKLSSYARGTVLSRYNGTSGFAFEIVADGRVQLLGYNGGASNVSYVLSSQSVPLNKWVHVAAQLDMATFTATPTTSYIMIDGVDVPAVVARGGTNPTALVQAGNLEIGSQNSGTLFFPGKIAQVAIYNAKVTQATILASMHQTLTGSETSLISAYSFNNTINDLSANANNLTANGSAVATNADSPFGQQADGTTAGTTEYAIITKTAFSTNTTLTVQVPEGNAIPTSGGVSAVSYSTQKIPFGFPASPNKWKIATLLRTASNTSTSNATYGAFLSGGYALTVPIGEWEMGHKADYIHSAATVVTWNISASALTGLTEAAGFNVSPFAVRTDAPAGVVSINSAQVKLPQSVTVQSTYVMYTLGASTNAQIDGTTSAAEIFAEFALL